MKWIILVLLLPLTAAASNDDHIRSRSQRAPFTESPATGTFQQDVDHFGTLPGQTFAQRYWIDSEYATEGAQAPVLFHICGEGDVERSYFLNDNALAWAQALGAHIVYLEHRYYGQSLPFTDFSTAHLLYLTLDNVIEDLAIFQKWLMNTQNWSGKWISLGGSYSGTLSAIYRLKHPELVVGALASSAPMISGIGQDVGGQSDVESLSSISTAGDDGERPWVYQACTTFGFWQADGPDIDANLQSPSAWLCQQLFSTTPLADSVSYNQNYDAPFLAGSGPSNILFTYGSDDVWTNLGLAQQTNSNPGISILMINGAGHHFDLNAPTDDDSNEVLAARTQFVTLAKRWLSETGPLGAR